MTGCYDEDQQRYCWDCERYRSFDDELIKGWTRELQINNNLEWCYELATDVTCWIVTPNFPNFPVIDNGENDELYEDDISFTDEEADARDDRPGRSVSILPDYRMN